MIGIVEPVQVCVMAVRSVSCARPPTPNPRRPFKPLAVIALVFLPAQWAAAECRSTANAADESTRGSVRLHASTTQEDCGGARTVYVRAWIESLASQCYTGTATGSGYCTNQDAEGSTGVTMGNVAHGLWNGHSTHWYIQGGQYQTRSISSTGRLTQALPHSLRKKHARPWSGVGTTKLEAVTHRRTAPSSLPLARMPSTA